MREEVAIKWIHRAGKCSMKGAMIQDLELTKLRQLSGEAFSQCSGTETIVIQVR